MLARISFSPRLSSQSALQVQAAARAATIPSLTRTAISPLSARSFRQSKPSTLLAARNMSTFKQVSPCLPRNDSQSAHVRLIFQWMLAGTTQVCTLSRIFSRSHSLTRNLLDFWCTSSQIVANCRAHACIPLSSIPGPIEVTDEVRANQCKKSCCSSLILSRRSSMPTPSLLLLTRRLISSQSLEIVCV